MNYYENGGLNPGGGVEALASRLISKALNKPVAHSPVESDWVEKERYHPPVSDPLMSAEMVSISYLHCILKGLWRAPRIICNGCFGTLFTDQIDFMISPHGCWGDPHKACRGKMPIIIVKENRTIYSDSGKYPGGNDLLFVESYLEAVGVIKAMDIGITRESVTRPLKTTNISIVT